MTDSNDFAPFDHEALDDETASEAQVYGVSAPPSVGVDQRNPVLEATEFDPFASTDHSDHSQDPIEVIGEIPQGFDPSQDHGDFDDYDGFDLPPGVDVETLLATVADLVRSARPMPLSSSSIINKDEVLDLVEEAHARLPAELRSARWMLKERELYLAQTEAMAAEIMATARSNAEALVQNTEVVRTAKTRAKQILAKAKEDAVKLRLDAEDYCDQRLGSFEIVLERTLKSVQAGRSKLQGTAEKVEMINLDDPMVSTSGFFDQDRE